MRSMIVLRASCFVLRLTPEARSTRHEARPLRMFFAAVMFSIATSASAMTLDDYIATLERVQTAVEHRDYPAARTAVQSLHGQTIESTNGSFAADDSLDSALAHPNPRLATRIAATIAELRAARSGAAIAAPNVKLVDEIDKEQHAPKPHAGGNLPLDNAATEKAQKFTERLGKAFDWVGEKLSDFFEWLGSFWPDSKTKDDTETRSIRGIVIGIAILIAAVVATLAWITIRRSRRAKAEVIDSAAPVASVQDEDPLSRASNEWERYAAQLAAASRWREAIRAWYHAVLVTLYGAAILHFRKGRTNWEYVAMLSPSLAWRRQFIELTRRFEHEWYGATDSSSEALDECARLARSIIAAVQRVQRGAA